MPCVLCFLSKPGEAIGSLSGGGLWGKEVEVGRLSAGGASQQSALHTDGNGPFRAQCARSTGWGSSLVEQKLGRTGATPGS